MVFTNCGTFSKEPEAYGFTREMYVVGASGCEIHVAGRTYIDTVMGLGSYPRGYDVEVLARVEAELHAAGGLTFGLPHYLWPEVKELVRDVFGVEDLRPVRTGSDGCLAAATLCRALRPGKIVVVEGAYHGQWLQWKPPAAGSLLDASRILPVNPWQPSTWPTPREVCCVFYEVPIHAHPPDWLDWMQHVQETGALLVADEVVTALRFPGNLGSRYLGLEPDLIVMGKGLANGFGFYCVAGRADLLRHFGPPDPVFVSTTYAGDVAALAGAWANLTLEPGREMGERLWALGRRFLEKVGDVSPLRFVGQPSRLVLEGKPGDLAFFRKRCMARGLFVNRPFVLSLAHDGVLDTMVRVIRWAVEEVHRGPVDGERLPLAKPLFGGRR